jgi:putative acetyltransferase
MSSAQLQIRPDDLRDSRIVLFLEPHIRDMRSVSPKESEHALDLDRLRQPDIQFWSAWDGEQLLGCGALKQLDARHGELKSMRSTTDRRRQGIGRQMLVFIVDQASAMGLQRLSLETGAMPFFAPARALYIAPGFEPCTPFGDYRENPNSVFMTRVWFPRARPRRRPGSAQAHRAERASARRFLLGAAQDSCGGSHSSSTPGRACSDAGRLRKRTRELPVSLNQDAPTAAAMARAQSRLAGSCKTSVGLGQGTGGRCWRNSALRTTFSIDATSKGAPCSGCRAWRSAVAAMRVLSL